METQKNYYLVFARKLLNTALRSFLIQSSRLRRDSLESKTPGCAVHADRSQALSLEVFVAKTSSKQVSCRHYLLLFLVIWTFALHAQSGNLLQNSRFENGQNNWSGWGSAVFVDCEWVQSGNSAARFQVRGNLEQWPVALEAGKTYRLSAWIRINSMSGDDWGGIRFSAIEADWSEWYSSDFYHPGNRQIGQWFNEVISFTPNSEQVRIQIGFFGGQDWEVDFSFDNLVLIDQNEINEPPMIEQVNLNALSGNAPFELIGEIIATDPDGVIQNYNVDTGDGAVFTGSPDFSHTYRRPGNYPLHITVVDDRGATDSRIFNIEVTGGLAHRIVISSPPTDATSMFDATEEWIDISGEVFGGNNQVFWINNKTMQSGVVLSQNSAFTVSGIRLSYGINIIHVQSSDGMGGFVKDEIRINYVPQGYSGPEVMNMQLSSHNVRQYERVDIRFDLNTIADNPFFPYEEMIAPGLNPGSGVSVDVVFFNGSTTLVQPAFYYQDYHRKGNHLVPSAEFHWQVRMAFKEPGTWSSTIHTQDSGGSRSFAGPSIHVIPDSLAKGYINVSDADDRYFEYDNGELFYPLGFGTNPSSPSEMELETDTWRENGLNFSRFWLSSQSPFSDSWSSWATHHPMENNGYMPPPLLTGSQKYGNGQFSYRIASPPMDNENTPAIFRGFWDGPIQVEENTSYLLTARVKTVNVEGAGGLVLKYGGWLGQEVVQAGVGEVISPYMRGDNDWTYLTAVINTDPGQHVLQYIYLVLEECMGEAFLDQMTLQEMNPDGSLKANILSKWNANTHLYLDPIKSKEADFLIGQAHEKDIHYKIVIHEKNDFISNSIDQAGFVSRTHGNFDQPDGSVLRRLYEYYWRHLIARWGYATSVHSWELVNEGAPRSYFNLTNHLSDYFRTNSPYHRMVTTSFWSNWEPEYWAESNADYADIHAYIMTTGWIDTITIDGVFYNREDLKNDAAAAVYAYSVTVGTDPQRTKPVVWGETDLDMPGSQDPDPMLALDTAGLWLHNFIWGHINHGGVSALIWNGDNIRNHKLEYRFAPYTAFMKGIDLHRGNYKVIDAISDNEQLRTWGQIRMDGRAAHFWIQNRRNTWRRVLEHGTPEPQSGMIQITGLSPGTTILEYWEPWSGNTNPLRIDTMEILPDGILDIPIENLVRDVAFKIYNIDKIEDPQAITDWPQYQQNSQRHGRSDVSVAPPYRPRWIWAGPDLTLRNMESESAWSDDLTSRPGYSFPIPDVVGFTISGSVQPVIKGERLYFATMEGDAYALDVNDGTTLWSARMDAACIMSAAVLDDKAIFVGVDGQVCAFDTLSGERMWSIDTRGSITVAPLVVNNLVIIANHKGSVLSINTEGAVLWESKLRVPIVGGIAASESLVYIPAEDMVVYALDINTGTIQALQKVIGQSFRLCHPVLFNGTLYVTSVTIPKTGSEYIMDEVVADANNLEEEEEFIKRWLQGDDNNGRWPYASQDWQHIFALDANTLENRFLIPAGPVDGVGYPAPSPVIDNEDRILRWWKTKFPYITTEAPIFGTNFTIDIAGINPQTGHRIIIDNGKLANIWQIETDNLYGLSVGGDYLWMRQNFRGTHALNLKTSDYEAVQVTTCQNDGGDFSQSHFCYRQTNLQDFYFDVPYIITQQRTAGRMAPALAGKYVFISEEFGIVAIESY
jgi:PKD repeat protein